MKRSALLLVLVAFGLGACERHDFEGEMGTRQLHEHGAHDSHTGDAADHTSGHEPTHGSGQKEPKDDGAAH